MSLFPKCTFQVLLDGGVFVPGTRADGILVVTAAEALPRAPHIDLAFQTNAWAGYGSGKQRSVLRRQLFHAPFRVPVPGALLPAGEHRFPFSVDVPTWLPPGFSGPDCAIEHEIAMRVDVDWAIDPKASLHPVVHLAPRRGVRAPLNARSPDGFHDSLVIEITLASSVITQGEPLVGQLALRSGHAARFDAIELALASVSQITMGRGDRRRGPLAFCVRIPSGALRSGGDAVPFQIPFSGRLSPSFDSAFIDHALVLVVSVDIPWARDPSFELPLQVLPPGSTVEGDGAASAVGSERLRLLALEMARATGLREGRAPTLVEGAVGPVRLRITDAPREAHLGIHVDLTFPDVELGIVFRRRGLLDGFREAPLLPEPLSHAYLLRAREDVVVSPFVTAALEDLASAAEIRFADHHLGLHFTLSNDEPERMVQIARVAHARASAIAQAIRQLPFPAAVAAAQAAWQATAVEQEAFLVPTGPALHGLTFGARLLGGEVRVAAANIRTVWTKEGPKNQVDVDLRSALLPEAARVELESETPSDRLRAVRAAFPAAHVLGEGRGVTLERSDWCADPRTLLPAIETFLAWVLEARGEQRSDLPYR